MNTVLNIITLMRPKHYIKNLLVLVPLFFSQQFNNYNLLATVLWGFLSFCLIASAVYIVNDINDSEQDRLHPTKKNRPIASGMVKKFVVLVLAFACFSISIAINFYIEQMHAVVWILVYLLINLLYSFGMKKIPIVDIVILTFGFIIRVVYGATIVNVTISGWLYLTVLSASFYLGLGKRRNELQSVKDGSTRTVLKHYNYNFLDKNMYVCLALVDAFYALWALDRSNPYIILTVPLVIVTMMKYSLDIESASDGEPVEVLTNDYILMGLVLLYCISMVAILYFA